jgi:hypothetical protein
MNGLEFQAHANIYFDCGSSAADRPVTDEERAELLSAIAAAGRAQGAGSFNLQLHAMLVDEQRRRPHAEA